jgi:hypothetical protein
MKNEKMVFNQKKEKRNIGKILWLLFGILLLSFLIGSVNAVFIDSCQTLSSANTVYKLNASIINDTITNDCIIISASNITLDCNGYSISSIKNFSGVMTNQLNTTVKNCNITMGGSLGSSNTNVIGIEYTSTANDGIIFNNTIFSYLGYGIFINGADRMNITKNIARSNILVAIRLIGSNDGILDSNIAYSNVTYAIGVETSSNNRIVSNVGTTTSNYGIDLENLNSPIVMYNNGTSVSGANSYGIYFADSNNALFNYNNGMSGSTRGIYFVRITISNITFNIGNGNYGMFFNQGGYNYIANNVGTGTISEGITIDTVSDSSIISNNGTSVSGSGFYLNAGLNNTYISNIGKSNSSYGMYFQTVTNSMSVSDIGISNYSYGIYAYTSHRNNFSSSTAIGNFLNSYGFVFRGSNDNIIKDCLNITSNKGDIFYFSTASNNNTFLNCSYRNESMLAGSSLIRKWYYQVYVNDTSGNPVIALINATNSSGSLEFSVSTNSSGYIPVQTITDYVNLAGTKYFYSLYNITAFNSGFSINLLSHVLNASKNNISDYFIFDDGIRLNITFISQNPADINSVNLFSNPLNITYFINATFSLNQSSIFLYYKTNKTNSEVIYYLNGTATSGFQQKSYFSNSTDFYLFKLFDNNVYPATYNINETLMENTVHTLQTLTSASDYASIELLNVSNSTQYSFFEIMANRTTGATALRYYYCNSSYNFGVSNAPELNSNCYLFYSDTDGTYNHTHTQYSSHKIAPFPINITTGSIGGIKITPVSYFMIRGASNWQYYYINNTSRTNAIRTTNNNAVSWTGQNYTIDAHLHQFSGNNTLWYYVCTNDGFGNSVCSSLRNDLLDLAGLPPSAPNVYNPFTAFYHSNFAINYTQSVSPNAYAVNYYNITLLNLNFSYNMTIISNNSNNLGYVFNSSLAGDGFYIIKVTACDNNSQCSSGFSNYFEIDNTVPYGDLIDPMNNSFLSNAVINFTINAFDNGSIGNLTLNIRYPNGTLINQQTIYTNETSGIFGIVYTFVSNGIYEWFYTIYDTAGNFFQTVIRTLTIVSVPSVSISYPINDTNYNYSVSQINYIVANGDYCWYSLDGGITNVTANCNANSITGIISDNGINVWRISANNSIGNETFAEVIFNSTCSNPEPVVQLSFYPYVDVNSSFLFNVSSFPVGVSNIKLQLNMPDGNISVYNMNYDNVSSYLLNLVFADVGTYSFVIYGDGICPTVAVNITGTLLVRSPYYVTICGFSDKTGTPYKNNFAYLIAEFESSKYNSDLDQFITPLGFKTTFKTSVFHADYVNGCGTLKLYESNASYVFRLFDGKATFSSSYSVPNITKTYGTNIQLGQYKLNGTSEQMNVYLSAKDINPYFWMFNWIMIIGIIAVIIISVFLFFILTENPQFALIFFIIMMAGLIIGRIVVWFYIG